MSLVTIDEVRAAAARIAENCLCTPLLESDLLSAELRSRVLVKAENAQRTGSFKVRGALNAVLARRERGELPAGIVTFSAGNHGAAAAYAGTRLGLRVIVCMPPTAVASKVEAVRRYGGEIVSTVDLAAGCAEMAEKHGFPTLVPFDDLDVIAGQGTVGLEICEQGPAPDLVLVPVGGGGLLSGIAVAVRALAPAARIVGVEPTEANAVSRALCAGRPIRLPSPLCTVADGLIAPFAGEHTLPHIQEYVDDVVEVSEEAIRDAWPAMVDATRQLVEPSAAVGLAAIRQGLVKAPADGTTVFVLSGGNTSVAALTGQS